MGNQGKGLRFITISGSYRKFIDEVGLALESFRNAGVTVLSPKSASILSSVDGFVSLRGDPIPRIDLVADDRFIEAMTLIENSHLHAIQQSDALWVVLPTNYCGAATALEVGWALAHRVPVFFDARYSQPESNRIFIDHMVAVSSQQVRLDSRAQEYVWIPPTEALRELDIEPNARKTIETYIRLHCRVDNRDGPPISRH